jgi:ribose transport system ATP-binding protein
MLALAVPVLRRVGLDLDPDVIVGTLSVADRQLVELSRVLLEAPRLLILDEPNSALNQRETARLFKVLRELVAAGVTALYVSHRLEEVFAIASRITVMRNAGVVWTRERAGVTIPQVVEAMVGVRETELFPPRKEGAAVAGGREPSTATAGSLVVRDLAAGSDLLGVSFEARPGEIVGIAGLEGSGVATLLGLLFGTRRPSGGEARFPDGSGLPRDTTSAARRGISLVPSDRRNHGLMLDRSIARNIAHVAVGAMPSRRPWLRRGEMIAAAQRQMRSLAIKASSAEAPVHELSGGNQQKVVIGKWLEVSPGVVLLDDPTRGVDVGAKREIYLLIRRLAEAGRIVIFRSTELPELVGLADRIVILYRGRVAGEVAGGAIDGTALLHAINTGLIEPDTATAKQVIGGAT